MTSKSHVKTDKKGRQEEWTWEESPALTKALKYLRALEARNSAIT